MSRRRLLISCVVVGALSTQAAAVAADPTPGRAPPPKSGYLQQVHERVHRRWSSFLLELGRMPAGSAYANPRLEAVVELSIEPDGAIGTTRVVRGSGLRGYDDAPLDLLREVGRVPPPPPELRSDDRRVWLTWRFRRVDPGCEDVQVTERQLPLVDALPQLMADGKVEEAARRVAATRRSEPAREREVLTLFVKALALSAARSARGPERAATAATLARLDGGEAPLLELAADPDRAVRRAALAALGYRSTTPARQTLERALLGDDAAVAATALGQQGDRSAVPSLRDRLAAAVAPAETAAALDRLGAREDAVRLAGQLLGDAARRAAGIQAVRALGDPGFTAPLVKSLSSTSDAAVRAAIADALAAPGPRTPPEARKALARLIGDASPLVRAGAIEALGRLGERSPSLRNRLLEAATDPDPRVRAAAAEGLVRVSAAGAAEEIARAARDRSPEVRAAVARALLAHPIDGGDKILGRLRADTDATVKAALASPSRASAGAPSAEDAGALAERLLASTEAVERLDLAARWLRAIAPGGPVGANGGGPSM